MAASGLLLLYSSAKRGRAHTEVSYPVTTACKGLAGPNHQVMSSSVPPAFNPSNEMLSLIGTCVSRLTDVVVITEAEPLDLPGPRIVFVNDAFELQTGYSRAEVIGKSPRILQGPLTDSVELRRISAAFRRWEPVRTELINYTKSGSAFHVEMDIVPIADSRGWYTHWVSIQRDVTSRKQAELEAATRDLQRTESIGTLAIGIAHDFNNIIAAILGNVVLGRHAQESGKDLVHALEQIDLAARRARNLVQQILAYARRQPQTFVHQPLGPLVLASAELLRAGLPAGVSVHVALEPSELLVSADAGQLSQVLLNLGTNSWHAMAGSTGRIDIRLVTVPLPLGSDPSAARQAMLEFEDDGGGMDANTLAHVFDPYFTTKAIGQGTGLGLSVVWGIVKAHGAAIIAKSEVGKGTIFQILFPLVDVKESFYPPAVTNSVAQSHEIGEEKLVLLVDDDEVVLLMLESILQRAAFRVLKFSDPLLALKAVRTKADCFDIVVTDLNMPIMSGLAFAEEIALIEADLPVIVGSGYVSDELLSDALRLGTAGVFKKESAADCLPKLVFNVLAEKHQRTNVDVSPKLTRSWRMQNSSWSLL